MKKKRSISLKTRDSLVGTLFMSPWLIGLLVFTLIPFIYSVWLSLCSVEFGPDGMQTAFVGGRWYKEIFSADAYFLQALKDTLQFIVLFMPMILVVAIICALLLNKALHGRTFFRIVVPMAKSIFVVIFSLSFAWQWTDTFYSNLLMGEVKLLPNVIAIMNAVSIGNKEMYYTMVKANAATILALLPLLLFYCLLQRKIIQGIERSGLVG